MSFSSVAAPEHGRLLLQLEIVARIIVEDHPRFMAFGILACCSEVMHHLGFGYSDRVAFTGLKLVGATPIFRTITDLTNVCPEAASRVTDLGLRILRGHFLKVPEHAVMHGVFANLKVRQAGCLVEEDGIADVERLVALMRDAFSLSRLALEHPVLEGGAV